GHAAYVLAGDRVPAIPTSCTGAAVRDVTVDALGQAATIAVTAPADCVLVVSTTYVSALHARAGDRDLDVFPIDVALTGIVVPHGTDAIVLAPEPRLPAWPRIAALLGLALLAAAVAALATAPPRA